MIRKFVLLMLTGFKYSRDFRRRIYLVYSGRKKSIIDAHVLDEKTEKQSDDSPKRGESREEHIS